MRIRFFLFFCLVMLGLAGMVMPEGRVMRYPGGTPEAAAAWQETLRAQLAESLHLADLVAQRGEIPFEAEKVREEECDGLLFQEWRLRATPGRTFPVLVARPSVVESPRPAVVCIHGHGGTRWSPFNPEESLYREFGTALARCGFVVISTEVGQHEVYEAGRTLMGERLWDLMRCVDYLGSLPEVAPDRIGCAGLSLGGEMAMWLGAMDTRIQATSSAGFLTMMDQMEKNHCMCWKFDGLRELADFPDIYALIAPRALQCQNGLLEPPTQFTVELATRAFAEIAPVYRDMDAEDRAALLVHIGGHEIHLSSMLAFLKGALGSTCDF